MILGNNNKEIFRGGGDGFSLFQLVGWLVVSWFWGGGGEGSDVMDGTSSFDHLLEEGFGLWKLYIFDTVYNYSIGGLWVRVLEVWEG